MTGRLVLQALALLACATSACAHSSANRPTSPHSGDTCLHYVPEDAFTGAEIAALDEAERLWRASGVCVVRGPGDVVVRRIASGANARPDQMHVIDGDEAAASTKCHAHPGPAIAFWASDERAIYVIADRIEADHLRAVFVHELGHAMGAQHVPLIHACLFDRVTNLCGIGGKVLVEDVAAVLPQYRFAH